MVQIYKIIVTSVTLPRGAVLRYFLRIVTFSMFLFLLKTIELLQIKFFTNVHDTAQECYLIKIFFTAFPPP